MHSLRALLPSLPGLEFLASRRSVRKGFDYFFSPLTGFTGEVGKGRGPIPLIEKQQVFNRDKKPMRAIKNVRFNL